MNRLEDAAAGIAEMLKLKFSLVLPENCEGEILSVLKRVQNPQTPADPEGYYKEIYNDRESMFSHTPYVLEERLIQAVRSGDETGAVEALSAINGAGKKAVLARDSLRSAKNSIICTAALLARASIQAGVAPESAFALSDAVIRKIEEFTTREAAFRYEEDVLLYFLKLVKRDKLKGHPRAVHRAIHYVDAHLTVKLKLADIARYAGVSAGYLSAVFSREMGMPLSEYILMRKIQESAYFIRNREHSAADVAHLYGFSGQSYYISVFKRFMGVTPGEYRNGGELK
ncbi:hypothetical protein FACS189490_02220 [Clostridia bacterium]|nr:hypothetical protein FACS189490_02220 [Clostridia bacterium]